MESFNEWTAVVFASDCGIDEDTGEFNDECPSCGGVYSECRCIGPTQDGYEYKEINGILYARAKEAMNEIQILNSAISEGIITKEEAYDALDLFREESIEHTEREAIRKMVICIADMSEAEECKIQSWQQQHGGF